MVKLLEINVPIQTNLISSGLFLLIFDYFIGNVFISLFSILLEGFSDYKKSYV